MTRRRALDWVLIVALTGLWAVLSARAIAEGLRNGRGYIGVNAVSAAAGAYPVVVTSTEPEIRPGDWLIALEGQDLRGRSALHFYDRATHSARERGSVLVRAERAGVPIEARISLTPRPLWALRLLEGAVAVAIGLFVLLRVPGWHLARLNFVTLWCFPAAQAATGVLYLRSTWLEVTLTTVLISLGIALATSLTQELTLSARPVPKRLRVLAVSAGLVIAASLVSTLVMPQTIGQRYVVVATAIPFGFGCILAGLTRTYRRSSSLERRQILWVVLGFWVTCAGFFCARVLTLLSADTAAGILSAVTVLGVPAGILVSVIGYRWLDVDRLTIAAASYTMVGVAVLGGAIALAPRVAKAGAPALGLDPSVAQWSLSLALVLAAIPAHRYLRAQLDRRLFRERHQRMSGLARLLDEVRACNGADELWRVTSERLDALLEPESFVVYAREGDAFTVRFTRGGARAAQYEEDSVLVRALARRGRPLAADSAELDPFDRAALETLGVALVVPIGTKDLLAFACLGRKRSGDIYTREESSQLGALAVRCAEVLRPGTAESGAPGHLFRREGDLWTIASSGKEIRLRDMRGLHYLATLLREPGREFHVNDLVAPGRSRPPAGAEDPDLVVARGLGDAGERLDARARAAYRARLLELDEELAEAERRSDLGGTLRARAEREALVEELSAATRSPRAGSHAERARVAVTKAIGAAIERIRASHPELGAHLSETIRRGYFCSYAPEPTSGIEWEA